MLSADRAFKQPPSDEEVLSRMDLLENSHDEQSADLCEASGDPSTQFQQQMRACMNDHTKHFNSVPQRCRYTDTI